MRLPQYGPRLNPEHCKLTLTHDGILAAEGAPGERLYVGWRDPLHALTRRVWVVEADGHVMPLSHVCCHSPDGFEWGYTGSGPADLALAILQDVLAHSADKGKLTGDWVREHYHAFKFSLVSLLSQKRWLVPERTVWMWKGFHEEAEEDEPKAFLVWIAVQDHLPEV